MLPFHVMGGRDVRAAIEKSRPAIAACVREAYLTTGYPFACLAFGLGVLDLAVGREVYALGAANGSLLAVPDFFAEADRW